MIKEVRSDYRARVLLVGLPGIGRVGHVAANYLIEKLKPEHVATLYYDSFPPAVVTDDKGIVRLIDNRFYLYNDILILTGDMQPDVNSVPPREHYSYAREIVEYALSKGVSEVYTMAGYDVGPKRFSDGTGVVCAYTDEETGEKLKTLGCEHDSGGNITGAAGLILGVGSLYGLKGGCVMGKTHVSLTPHGDPGAAAEVLKVVTKLTGIEVDLKELEDAEQELKKLINTIITTAEEIAKKEQKPERPEYIT